MSRARASNAGAVATAHLVTAMGGVLHVRSVVGEAQCLRHRAAPWRSAPLDVHFDSRIAAGVSEPAPADRVYTIP